MGRLGKFKIIRRMIVKFMYIEELLWLRIKGLGNGIVNIVKHKYYAYV